MQRTTSRIMVAVELSFLLSNMTVMIILYLPLFLSYPIKHRFIACAPLLESIDLSQYINGVDHVTVSGETGKEARICDYDWVMAIREECIRTDITFWFKSTGSYFRRDGVAHKVNPYKQSSQAKELGINILNGKRLN